MSRLPARALPSETPSVPSAAFLVTAAGGSYLHLGDTGPTRAVWDRARPLFKAGQLKAVAIEVSFPSTKQAFAVQTGHLTPRLLLLELAKLAGLDEPLTSDSALSEGAAVALAKRLAPHFTACPVMTIHIKGLDYDEVAAELETFKKAGLNLVLPKQGHRYDF